MRTDAADFRTSFIRLMGNRTSAFFNTGEDHEAPGILLSGLFILACLAPSSVPTARRDAISLALVAPLGATTSWLCWVTASESRRALVPCIPCSPGVAAVLAALPASAALAYWIAGGSRQKAARAGRCSLAFGLCWLLLVDWNGWRLPLAYFPGWVGCAGAAMLVSGEWLAQRRDS